MQFLSLNHLLQPVDVSEQWQTQRCFLYGDGHFTTAKITNGNVAYLEHHINRLKLASERLKFAPLDYAKLVKLMAHLVEKVPYGVLKIQISRGQGIRGYGNSLLAKPFVFIWVTKTVTKPNGLTPIKLMQVETPLGHNKLLAGLKHCNRLEQVLVARELEEADCADGLVSDFNGNLIESSKANVFWLEGGKWFTPELTYAGVAGIMRGQILSQAEATVIQAKAKHVVTNCEAMFICNSLIGVQAVESINNKKLALAPVEEFRQNLSIEND